MKGRIPIIVDGGFRRGTDIFKAIALGANAVMIGRPYIWGLAAFGQRSRGRARHPPQGATDRDAAGGHRAARRHQSLLRHRWTSPPLKLAPGTRNQSGQCVGARAQSTHTPTWRNRKVSPMYVPHTRHLSSTISTNSQDAAVRTPARAVRGSTQKSRCWSASLSRLPRASLTCPASPPSSRRIPLSVTNGMWRVPKIAPPHPVTT